MKGLFTLNAILFTLIFAPSGKSIFILILFVFPLKCKRTYLLSFILLTIFIDGNSLYSELASSVINIRIGKNLSSHTDALSATSISANIFFKFIFNAFISRKASFSSTIS